MLVIQTEEEQRTPQEGPWSWLTGTSIHFEMHHPWEDVPDIPSQQFNHLIAEMKTKLFVCCSDLPWAFGGRNSTLAQSKGVRLPVILQPEFLTARMCSVAGVDGPGDTLCDWMKHKSEVQWAWWWRSCGRTQSLHTSSSLSKLGSS